jgi:hypothetical protein
MGGAEMALTRHEIAAAKRRQATEEKLAKVLARHSELDESESMRKLYLDVQQIAARRMHDVSMAANREWFHSSVTRSSGSLPGPGSYSLASNSAFSESTKSVIEPLRAMAGRPPLLSGSASSPGPAAYSLESKFLDRFKNAGAVKFNGRPTSFAMDAQHAGPGPAAYLPIRIDLKHPRSAPFGASTVPAREEIKTGDAPAPTSYTPHEITADVRARTLTRSVPRAARVCAARGAALRCALAVPRCTAL